MISCRRCIATVDHWRSVGQRQALNILVEMEDMWEGDAGNGAVGDHRNEIDGEWSARFSTAE